MESYKQEKIIIIMYEYLNDKREFYPISNVPLDKAKFFYKDDDGLFKLMAISDYTVKTELNENRLYIVNAAIKDNSEKFQIGYEINFKAAEYESPLPVLSVLTKMYNQLIEDTRILHSYIRKQCFVADGKEQALVLPGLPAHTVWCMGENGKMFALPVSELYERFGKLIKAMEKVLDEYIEQKKEEIRGPAGAIDNVTASVNSNAGTPKVTVSLGGTPERRKIDLKFENLKGDKPIKGTDYYTEQEKEQFATETKALVQAEGNKVVEQVKTIVAGNPATTNALTLSGKTRVEFEEEAYGVLGKNDKTFPLNSAELGKVYWSPLTKKFYRCTKAYKGVEISTPNKDNFEEINVYENNNKIIKINKETEKIDSTLFGTKEINLDWESGSIGFVSSSEPPIYRNASNIIRTPEGVSYYLKAGDIVNFSGKELYVAQIHWNYDDKVYGFYGNSFDSYKITKDGEYRFVITIKDSSSIVDRVQEVGKLLTIYPASKGLVDDVNELKNNSSKEKGISLTNLITGYPFTVQYANAVKENNEYKLTVTGENPEPKIYMSQNYSANRTYLITANIKGDFRNNPISNMYSRIESNGKNYFSDWSISKYIKNSNVNFDCRELYHVFTPEVSGNFRTSFTVSFGSNDNAKNAKFSIGNINIIDITETNIEPRELAKSIFAQHNGYIDGTQIIDISETINFPFKNYNIAFFGDSILGNYGEHGKLSEKIKANVTRCAIGGTTLSDTAPLSLVNITNAMITGDYSKQDEAATNSMYQDRVNKIKNLDIPTLDYIVIEIGTNDWRRECDIGTDDSTDITTIKGAYNTVIKNFYTLNPFVKIIILTPLFRTEFNANTTPNGKGVYLRDVVQAVKEIAKNWNISIFDMYYKGGVNSINSTKYLSDGTHPTPLMEYRIVDIIHNMMTIYKY